MSVTSIHERLADRSGHREPSRVVAVVLEDGTVRPVDGGSEEHRTGPRWGTGRLSGPDWVLWWERRSWTVR